VPDFSLLIKPAGPDCNLACPYCFYARKTDLFGAGRHRMTLDTLETLTRDYLALDLPVHAFAWQGGEPMLLGLDFYRQAIELQKKYGAPGRTVANALQTNAILLDDAWCPFLAEYKFLLGVSLDGPRDLHDHYRRDPAGRGSFDRVLAALAACRRRRVEFNILVLLHDRNVREPDALFDFFLDQRLRYLQFIPGVELDPVAAAPAAFSITPQQYADFLCRFFDRWLPYGPENISVRLFDSLLSYYLHGRHTECTFCPRCDQYVVVEHNGDVFACDFFVEPAGRLGNLHETPIGRLAAGPAKERFAARKRLTADRCLACRHRPLCQGGCLKDRRVLSADTRSLSYFCPAYKQFFDHALPHLQIIASDLYLRLSPS